MRPSTSSSARSSPTTSSAPRGVADDACVGSPQAVSGELAEDGVGESGPRLLRPVAERRVSSAPRTRSPGRGRPTGTSRCRRSGRTSAARSALPDQWPSFAPLSSTPRPQSSGVKRPKSGSTPSRPGNWTRTISSCVSPATSTRGEQLAAQCQHVVQRPVHPRARMTARVEPEVERRDHGFADVVGKRHLGSLARCVAEHAEALVRVDPASPGRRDRRLTLERKAGRVREQVPYGRARWAGRLVEVDGRPPRRRRGSRARRSASTPMRAVRRAARRPGSRPSRRLG